MSDTNPSKPSKYRPRSSAATRLFSVARNGASAKILENDLARTNVEHLAVNHQRPRVVPERLPGRVEGIKIGEEEPLVPTPFRNSRNPRVKDADPTSQAIHATACQHFPQHQQPAKNSVPTPNLARKDLSLVKTTNISIVNMKQKVARHKSIDSAQLEKDLSEPAATPNRGTGSLSTISPLSNNSTPSLAHCIDSSLNLSTVSGQSCSSFDNSPWSKSAGRLPTNMQQPESRIPLPKRLTQPMARAAGKSASVTSVRHSVLTTSQPKVERSTSLRVPKRANGEFSLPKSNSMSQKTLQRHVTGVADGAPKKVSSSTLKIKAVSQRVNGPLPAGATTMNSKPVAPKNNLPGNTSTSTKVKLKASHSPFPAVSRCRQPFTVGISNSHQQLPVAPPSRRANGPPAPEECSRISATANGEKEVVTAAPTPLLQTPLDSSSNPLEECQVIQPTERDKAPDTVFENVSSIQLVKVKPCETPSPVSAPAQLITMGSESCDSSINSDTLDLDDEPDRSGMTEILSVSLVDALANLAVEDAKVKETLVNEVEPTVEIPHNDEMKFHEDIDVQLSRTDTKTLQEMPEVILNPVVEEKKKKSGASHRRKFLRKMTSLTSMLYGNNNNNNNKNQTTLGQRSFSKELLLTMEREHRTLKGETNPPAPCPPVPHFDPTWIQDEVDTALQRLTPTTRGRSCSIPCTEVSSPVKPVSGTSLASQTQMTSSEGLSGTDLGSSQRSLSLPKSFLSNRYGLVGIRAALPSVRFPWRKSGKSKKDGSETGTQTEDDEGCSTPPLPPSPRPPLPASKKIGNDTINTTIPYRPGRKPRGTPVRSLSVCDLQRPWSHMYITTDLDDLPVEAQSRLQTSAGEESSHTSEESQRRKFRKSLSLRFPNRPESMETETEPNNSDTLQTINESRSVEVGQKVPGRLREVQKAARSSKCNSGDSGIEVQTGGTPDVIKKMVTPLELGSQEKLSPEFSDSSLSMCHKRGMKRSAAHSHLLANACQPKVTCTGENGSYPDTFSSEDELDEGYNSRPLLGYALWAHEPEEGELKLEVGDEVEILDASNINWWWGACKGKYGWVPASYLQMADEGMPRSPSRLEVSAEENADTNDVRGFVVQELVTAEKDFVKLLQDLVEGFLEPCKRHPDLFSQEQIQVIFGNLEQVYTFQKKFLASLEQCVDWKCLKKSRLGRAFLRHVEGFAVYSDYCQNHAHAVAVLQSLYKQDKISQFLETCRLLRNMIRLPLDGFLLTPIQRLCKYPLLLTELKKHTPTRHADYSAICLALDKMKEVASEVNEAQRRLEQRQQVQQWQNNIDHWQGEDLMLSSTKLWHQGELQKISPGGWAKDVLVGLFDSQIVICKKDIVRRNAFIYKDRIQIDQCHVTDVPDGRDTQFGCQVRNGWKIRCLCRDKWFLFTCRTLADKLAWLKALQNARTNLPTHISPRREPVESSVANPVDLKKRQPSFTQHSDRSKEQLAWPTMRKDSISSPLETT